MSSSSDEGEPFQLRDFEEDTDDERPNKRRKTVKTLRGRGIGFVSSNAPPQDDAEQEEDEDDVDDERPTMGGFRSSFDIGEFSGQREPSRSPPPTMGPAQTQTPVGTGPSAFGAGGRIQKNSFAARMMAKQGYVEGQGLGKTGQGITAPIKAQVLQTRAGLGAGGSSAEPARRPPKAKASGSRPSTPGTSTPKLKAPPKTRYTVAAIESRGLHIPDAMKSIIIDATGAENKTVTSLSGFSTPTREASPATEAPKRSARIKMQLQAYAEAWDSTKEQETRLDLEEAQLEASLKLYDQEAQQYQDLVSSFERVSADDSAQPRSWDDIIVRLQAIQADYSESITDLELPGLAVSCLEAPFRSVLVDWDPLTTPAPPNLISSLQSLASLLSLPKHDTHHSRKRTTPLESLLLLHWYPHILTSLKHWSPYDPDPAYNLITTWSALIPPWLTYKILHTIILPKLTEAVRRFPRTVDTPTSNGTSTNTPRRKAPDLHTWLFDWWTLLSAPDLELESFPTLRSLVKQKLTSDTWPIWKPLLGSDRRTLPSTSTSHTTSKHKTQNPPTSTSQPSTPATPAIEVSFRDIVEDWCTEHNLLLRSTNTSDAYGRLLYRLSDAEKKSKGVLVYLLDDVVFSVEGEPFGLDDGLVGRARG